MTVITAEKSAPKPKTWRRRSRPLTRRELYDQRYAMRVTPDGTRAVGMLISRAAADDQFARWLITPIGVGSVVMQRVDWESVAAGEWFAAPFGSLTDAEVRTLTRWLRRELERGQ